MSKRKHNVGREVPEKWVFGLYDVHQKIGVLEFVENKKQETLFPIIKKYIRGATIIHSDSASMYVNNAQQQSHIVNISTIPMPPYQHVWVNHTMNFVDPITGACTNHVEGFWKNAKQKNKAMSGTTAELLPSYLDEFQWRQMYGKKTSQVFDNILAQIAHYYPVNN
jgi:transposase-like protein